MDSIMLATKAIGLAKPYIMPLAKKAAESVAGEVGKTVWEWIKGKLTSPGGQEAVKDLETVPDDAVNVDAVKVQLAKLLKSDPQARSELARLLEKSGEATNALSANTVGDNNILGQAADRSSVVISADRGAREPSPPGKRD